MSSLTILGDTSGSVALTAAAVAGSTAITIAAQSGTLNVGGPSFSAYVTGNQSMSSGTFTKMQCGTEEWDTANCYDNVTNYRFTPNVAGYYQFNGMWGAAAGSPTRIIAALYKNGSVARYGLDLGASSASFNNGAGSVVNAMLYMNGTTDYVELYAYSSGGVTIQGGSSASGYFQGFLARTA